MIMSYECVAVTKRVVIVCSNWTHNGLADTLNCLAVQKDVQKCPTSFCFAELRGTLNFEKPLANKIRERNKTKNTRSRPLTGAASFYPYL